MNLLAVQRMDFGVIAQVRCTIIPVHLTHLELLEQSDQYPLQSVIAQVGYTILVAVIRMDLPVMGLLLDAQADHMILHANLWLQFLQFHVLVL